MTGYDHHRLPGFIRTVLAVVVFAVGAVVSLVAASGVAYLEPQGTGRLREVAPALAGSVAVGFATVAVVLALLRRRVISARLAVGGLPAAALSLNHLGVVG